MEIILEKHDDMVWRPAGFKSLKFSLEIHVPEGSPHSNLVDVCNVTLNKLHKTLTSVLGSRRRVPSSLQRLSFLFVRLKRLRSNTLTSIHCVFELIKPNFTVCLNIPLHTSPAHPWNPAETVKKDVKLQFRVKSDLDAFIHYKNACYICDFGFNCTTICAKGQRGLAAVWLNKWLSAELLATKHMMHPFTHANPIVSWCKRLQRFCCLPVVCGTATESILWWTWKTRSSCTITERSGH